MTQFETDEYKAIAPILVKVNDCYEGSDRIKSKKDKYLTKFPREDNESYRNRLKDAVFYNYLKETVDNYLDSLFFGGIKVETEEKNELWLNTDIDGEGGGVSSVMREAARKSILDGVSFLWVDAPSISGTASKKDVDDGLFRPFIKVVDRLDVLSISFTNVKGKKVLKKVIIKQQVLEENVSNPLLPPKKVDVFCVLEVNKGTIYKNLNGSTDIVSQWTNNLGYIPIIPVYSDKNGFMNARVPFSGLADINIRHYQAQSNYDSILNIVATPVPVIYGMNEADIDSNDIDREGKITIGPSSVISFGSKTEAGVEYLELTGNNITYLENQIKALKEEIEKLGLLPDYQGNFETAAEANFSDKVNSLFLVEINTSMINAFNQCFRIFSDFMGVDFYAKVTNLTDFKNKTMNPQVLIEVTKARVNRDISLDTYLNVLKDGKILPEDLNIDKEKSLLADEISASLGV